MAKQAQNEGPKRALLEADVVVRDYVNRSTQRKVKDKKKYVSALLVMGLLAAGEELPKELVEKSREAVK